ncbi:MAG: hypothetical protein ACFCD0_23820 [Gemmataceae bacterium]
MALTSVHKPTTSRPFRVLDDRLRRLYAVGCCRSLDEYLSDTRAQTALEVASEFADGTTSSQELEKARKRILAAAQELDALLIVSCAYKAVAQATHPIPQFVFTLTPIYVAEVHTRSARTNPQFAKKSQRHFQHDLLRELLGEHQCPTSRSALLQARTEQVSRIADHIYRHHRFEDMPILGDALEEAGLVDETVLAHCRSSSHHVRGCWVVDTLLGK